MVITEGGDRFLKDDQAHNIDEFFITRKYRRKGIGRVAAMMAFDMHKGNWEVCQMQDNISAQQFWLSVIDQYTTGNYEKYGTMDDEMVGLIFNNSTF